ncbi:hypothetical protein HOY82DRAFT_135567 [Tuber indicum]|nr:hypothetical protein HOY82DRAFT_135567 [Tuber indicum]
MPTNITQLRVGERTCGVSFPVGCVALFVSVGLTIRRPDTIANSRRGNIFFEIFAEFFDMVTRFFALLGFSLVLWVLFCLCPMIFHDVSLLSSSQFPFYPLLFQKNAQKIPVVFSQSGNTSFYFFSFLPHL